MISSLTLILILFIQEKPCADAELKASMCESRLAAERAKAQSAGARRDAVERELIQAREQLSAAQEQLAAEQKRSASLAAANEQAHKQIAEMEVKLRERDKTITARDARIVVLTGERDKAQADTKRARRWGISLIRVFGVVKK